MATCKAEFLAHYYGRRRHPLRDHLFGHIDWWAMVAARVPRLVNALASVRPIVRPFQSAAGVAPERQLPRFATETFQRWMARRQPRREGTPVIVWSDTFTNKAGDAHCSPPVDQRAGRAISGRPARPAQNARFHLRRPLLANHPGRARVCYA
jgi:hypothetical protein